MTFISCVFDIFVGLKKHIEASPSHPQSAAWLPSLFSFSMTACFSLDQWVSRKFAPPCLGGDPLGYTVVWVTMFAPANCKWFCLLMFAMNIYELSIQPAQKSSVLSPIHSEDLRRLTLSWLPWFICFVHLPRRDAKRRHTLRRLRSVNQASAKAFCLACSACSFSLTSKRWGSSFDLKPLNFKPFWAMVLSHYEFQSKN